MRNLVMVFLMMVFSAFSTVRAEGGKIFNYMVSDVSIYGYTPGAWNDSRIEEALRAFTPDSTAEYMVVGIADSIPFKSCGADAFCSKERNQALASLRADVMVQALIARGVPARNIMVRSEVKAIKGGDFRGVIVWKRVSAPLVVPTPVSTVAPSVPSVNSSLRVVDSLNSLNQKVTSLQDSLAVLSKRVKSLDQAQWDHERNVGVPIKKEVSKSGVPFANVDVGIGMTGMKAKDGVDSFTPTLALFIKPRGVPFELTLEGGYRPQRSSNICNRADVSGAIGLHVPVRDLIGITGGVFTDRESCTDGGPKLIERWVERTNGLYLGFVSGVDLNNRFRLDMNPALTWAGTRMAQGDRESKNSLGFRVGLEIRTHGKH